MTISKSISTFIFTVSALLVSGALISGCYSAKAADADSRNAAMPGIHPETVSGQEAPAIAFSGEDKSGGDADKAGSGDRSNDSADVEESEEIDSGKQSALDAALELTETSREYLAGGELDNALESLDQAYALTLQVDPGDDSKLIRQKEEIRFTISRSILELYSSRYIARNGSRNAIPLTINTHVELEIERFKKQERASFIEAYKRSRSYRGEIVRALKDAGLPEELSWIPLIVSGFRPETLSRSRALGLWQFIPSTGYKFGLMRNEWLDERMDPAKSTFAAIAYLKELYSIFGDWAPVLAAYDYGEGAIMNVIRQHKINYFDNFWVLYDRLPYDTVRNYPRFLAVLAILKDPLHYGIVLEEGEEPRRYDVVTVEKQVHLKSVAEALQVSFEELAALNPELRRDVTPGVPYPLKVHQGMGGILLSGLDTIPVWTAPQRAYLFHRVRRGETLSLLALRYRTSIRAIAQLNRIRPNSYLRVGQKLKINLAGKHRR